MAEDLTDERLGDKHHVALILRLLVDSAGRLINGEIRDLSGMTHKRFAAWDTLAASVRAVLSEHDR